MISSGKYREKVEKKLIEKKSQKKFEEKPRIQVAKICQQKKSRKKSGKNQRVVVGIG